MTECLEYFGLAVLQHEGRRDYQEDCVDFSALKIGDKKMLILVLADGMGGHVGGAQASRLSVDKAMNNILSGLDNRENISSTLENSVFSANESIQYFLDKHPQYSGMGSTLVVSSISEMSLEFASVGDSPFWLFRRGELRRLNANHSMAPVLDDLVETGRLTHDEALSDPRRNALRSALSCLLYTSPSPRDKRQSRMPSSA